MTLSPALKAVLTLLILVPMMAQGQRSYQAEDSVKSRSKKTPTYDRFIQFSLYPRIGTNGRYSSSFRNTLSFNLLGGISAGNKFLEISPISNGNIQTTTGIQFAGLANFIGINAFQDISPTEAWLWIREGFSSSMKGLQVAGVLNYVRDDATGIQLSGGFNATKRHFKGVQLGGIANSTGGESAGLQAASLFNLADDSMTGIQLSLLFNYTRGRHSGAQVGLVNKSGATGDKKTKPQSRAGGIQFGLVNFSKGMNGTQIGLVNFGGNMLGRQFGLINFFNTQPTKENVKLGTSFGLITLGSRGPKFRVYANELFLTSIEYSTGNCLNCSPTMSEMPYNDNFQKFFQNSLMIGYDQLLHHWGFGYGFQRTMYSKAVMYLSAKNGVKLINYGVRFMHLSRGVSFDNTFNLLTKLNLDYGRRKRGGHVYGSLSVNYFIYQEENPYEVRSVVVAAGKVSGLQSQVWPGYALGYQF